MRRKTRKETSWEHRKRITFLWKEKKVGELQLSWRHLRRLVNVLTQREDEIRIHKNNPSASAAPAAYEPRWIYWGGCWRCDRFAPLNRAVVLKAYKRSYTLLRFYTSKEKQNRYFCFYNWVNKISRAVSEIALCYRTYTKHLGIVKLFFPSLATCIPLSLYSHTPIHGKDATVGDGCI